MDYQTAIRTMLQIVDPVLAPLVNVVVYPNTATAVPTSPGTAASWARVTVQHSKGRQRSIPTQNQHYNQVGVLTIQLFQPSGRGIGSNTAIQPLLDALINAAPLGALFFKNVTPIEVGTSGPWFATNILAEFDYDTIRNVIT